jgi:xanthine dehydrogenase molybdenum-binding subunit
MLNCIINGKAIAVEIQPGEMLSDVLRYRLGLTGTKIGCGEAECGACTVLVDGEPIVSCLYPASRTEAREILTIEGLVEGGSLHPLQEAFIETGAVQCGFCIPGQIMTSYALLQENPNPSETDIRGALKDTLCRCAGYPTIVKAVQAASHRMQGNEPLEMLIPRSGDEPAVVGSINPRPDSVDKVTGEAKFTDDYQFPDMLVGKVLRAGVPHAILEKLEVAVAREVPGVVTILTAEDIPGENLHGIVYRDWPVLVGIGEKVRYVGDAIAIVAAKDDAAAREAIQQIRTQFRELPIVSDPVYARSTEAEEVHAQGNLLKHIKVCKGEMEAGWARADITMEGRFHTPATDHAFMEPECSIAIPLKDGRMEVLVGSQIPYADREQVARALGVTQDLVGKRISPDRSMLRCLPKPQEGR